MPQNINEPHLWTIDQAAERLAVSTRTVKRLISSGDLVSITIGRSRRVPSSAIHELIERRVAELTDPQQRLGA